MLIQNGDGPTNTETQLLKVFITSYENGNMVYLSN